LSKSNEIKIYGKMALFTPKNYPWKLTKGYEPIDAFEM
jgi:hypothetical protein